jgi:hypothetical protein
MEARPLRWALALHPRAWRQRYGQELLDLSEELLTAHETTRSRLVLGLLASALAERTRAILRMSRLAVLTSFVAVLVVVGAVALITGVFAPGTPAHTGSAMTVGGVQPSKNGQIDLRAVPDFVKVSSGGELVGYEPRAFVFPSASSPVNSPVSPKLGAVGPVYARNLKTLIGHEYPGIGFVPVGTSPSDQPCVNEYTISSDGGTTTTSTIACPTTTEVVPNLVGMFLPTAMGALSEVSLNGEITYVHSASTPVGHILSQSPAPGTKVHARMAIHVVSSVPATAPTSGS